MFDGERLVRALQTAMEAKKRVDPRYGPTALARDLGITQPSASELMKTGRIKKERYSLLVEAFQDVVGPDHWGLPYTATDFRALRLFQQLPQDAQQQLVKRMAEVLEKIRTVSAPLDAPLPASGEESAPTSGETKRAAVGQLPYKPPLAARGVSTLRGSAPVLKSRTGNKR